MTEQQAINPTLLRFELPHPSAELREVATSLATACFTFEHGAVELRPDELEEEMLNREARRLASIADVGDRQEAILANLRSYVRLAADAQRVAISFLQTAKSVDRLSVQLHDVKESVAKPLKPR